MTYNLTSSSGVAFDDLANASGLGTPAILNGTVSLHKASGLVLGAGQSQGVQTTNATAIQNCINYAVTNGKFIEALPYVYEFYSSTGLTIPHTTNGFVWRGSRSGTILKQFYGTTLGAPVLTVGDITGAALSRGIDIDGMMLLYGAAQTGFTSATTLLLCAVTASRFTNINLGIGGAFGAPYRCMALGNGTAGTYVYSNTFNQMTMFYTQQDYIYLNGSGSTGNSWTDIYMGTGTVGSPAAISGNFINGVLDASDQQFKRINCEWTSLNTVFNLGSNLYAGMKFENLHLEGLTLTGFSPSIFKTANMSIGVDGFELQDTIVTSGNVSGSPCVVFDYAPSPAAVQINNMNVIINNTGELNTNFFLYQANGGVPADDVSIMTINHLRVRDASGTSQAQNNMVFDPHLPQASFPHFPEGFSRYSWGAHASKIEKANIAVSATYTHYGQYEDATILVPASITSFNLTLSALMGATGTQAVRTGNTTHVRRLTGSAAGTLTVKDDAATTLTTSTTAPADLWYVFNGTHYVTFTPVT